MKKALLLACLSFLLAGPRPVYAQPANNPIVAIFDINTKRLKLKASTRELLTKVLSTELASGGVFKVMPPGDIKRALMQEAAESYKDCYEEKCQIELGRQLAANKMLTTTIIRIGRKCRVSASLYDLKRQATDTSAVAKGACGEEGLVGSIEVVAAKLRGFQSGAPAQASAAASAKDSYGGYWPPACTEARQCLLLADKLKTESKQDLALMADMQGALLAFRAQRYTLGVKLSKRITDLLDGYVPRIGQVRSQLLRACGQEDKDACFIIARILHHEKQFDEAMRLYRRACNAGQMIACSNLAVILQTGEEKDRDLEGAVKMYEKACRGGLAVGCYGAGEARRLGRGAPRDIEGARRFLKKGCDQGFSYACVNYGESFILNRKNPPAEAYAKAFDYNRKACDLEHGMGCFNVGHQLRRGEGRKVDRAAAFEYYQKGCDYGYIPACNSAAIIAWQGQGVPKNETLAVILMQKGCDGNDLVACSNLGDRYRKGVGVTKDIVKAKTLLTKACTGGNQTGCKLLKTIQ